MRAFPHDSIAAIVVAKIGTKICVYFYPIAPVLEAWVATGAAFPLSVKLAHTLKRDRDLWFFSVISVWQFCVFSVFSVDSRWILAPTQATNNFWSTILNLDKIFWRFDTSKVSLLSACLPSVFSVFSVDSLWILVPTQAPNNFWNTIINLDKIFWRFDTSKVSLLSACLPSVWCSFRFSCFQFSSKMNQNLVEYWRFITW